MLPNGNIPSTGVNSDCVGTWKIYILDPHGLKWRPIGMMADRATAEYQLASLRRFMPGRRFTLAWENQHHA